MAIPDSDTFSNYDGQFILRYLIEKGSSAPKQLIMNGNSIIMVRSGGIRFVDSWTFLEMKLAELPATFGLTELKKAVSLIY